MSGRRLVGPAWRRKVYLCIRRCKAMRPLCTIRSYCFRCHVRHRIMRLWGLCPLCSYDARDKFSMFICCSSHSGLLHEFTICRLTIMEKLNEVNEAFPHCLLASVLHVLAASYVISYVTSPANELRSTLAVTADVETRCITCSSCTSASVARGWHGFLSYSAFCISILSSVLTVMTGTSGAKCSPNRAWHGHSGYWLYR